ncbi:MAG TPA: hypothetical protein VNX88_19870 [Terriglobales bacterium]|jgi:DNA-binding response OmpR family regulator|nr:hypothetical protein [Terriglobales bacterium]
MPTVLLLEDLDSDASEVESALSQIGDFEVKRFQAASQAVDYLSDVLHTNSELPALIVVDLNLSDSSGYELLRFYHATPGLAEVPLTVWSVLDGEIDKKLTTWMGSKKLISKNSGPTTLRKSLSSLLRTGSEAKRA